MNLVNTENGKLSPPSVSPRAARAAAMLVKSLQLRFQAQHLLAVEDLDGMVDGLHCLTSPGGDKNARLIEIQPGLANCRRRLALMRLHLDKDCRPPNNL